MTVVVSILCTDGVVVAADSMLTSSVENIDIARHTGKKLHALGEVEIFAYAGDQGLGHRFRIEAEAQPAEKLDTVHPIKYPLKVSKNIRKQFRQSGFGKKVELDAVLAYAHNDAHHCCVFDDRLHPMLLDNEHYFNSIGSGKVLADPFLLFLVKVFCQDGPPDVRRGVFLAAWAIEHVIQTNAGGVAGPICVATLERAPEGGFVARELGESEVDDHLRVMEETYDYLPRLVSGIETNAWDDDGAPFPDDDEA